MAPLALAAGVTALCLVWAVWRRRRRGVRHRMRKVLSLHAMVLKAGP